MQICLKEKLTVTGDLITLRTYTLNHALRLLC